MNAHQRRKAKRRGQRLMHQFLERMQPLADLILAEPKRAAEEMRAATVQMARELGKPL